MSQRQEKNYNSPMAKNQALEKKLAELRALEAAGQLNADKLRAALHDKQSIVIAKAGDLIAKSKLAELEKDLIATFHRLLAEDYKSDPGCSAKLAIVKALDAIESRADAVFVSGVHHVQPEPSWGGQSDTAGELRGTCA